MAQVDRPSWNNGFAYRPDESDAPDQWDGLVGAWSPFLGVQGSTFYDVSGNGNHATLTSASLTASWITSSRGITWSNGTSDYGSAASSDSLNRPSTAITLICWTMIRGQSESWAWICGKIANVGGGRGHFIRQQGTAQGGLVGALSINSAYQGTSQTSTVSSNIWHGLALTWQSGEVISLRVFSDHGSLLQTQVSTSQSGTLEQTANAFHIGANETAGSNWNGYIDSVRMYDRRLHYEELVEIMEDPYAMYRLRRRVWAVDVSEVTPAPLRTLMLMGVGR